MSNQAVKARRKALEARMTCSLCNKLFRDATTISECLHTFCRKCIYKKLTDEDLESCPICNIDLGCVPEEKLRPDNTLQDVRAKIFPYKRRKVKAQDVMCSVTLPLKRKERSLSSLVVSAPRVTTQSGMTGRRSKYVGRKPLRKSTFSIEKFINKDEPSSEGQLDNSTIPVPETSDKCTHNLRQNVSNEVPSIHSARHEDIENDAKEWEKGVDMWSPLNCLVEVANRSKSSRLLPKGSALKSEPSHISDIDGYVYETKIREHGHKLNVEDGKLKNCPTPEQEKPKKLRRIQKKKPALVEFNNSPNVVLDNPRAKLERSYPIWFSLVASVDQAGGAPLPQISASYLRIKDGSIPVSSIQKYLVRKLDLMNDDEVEIRCMGQSLVPTLQLNNLVDLWIQMSSNSDRLPVRIGTSAKDFVMVLVYGRRRLAS
ncbi:hypothetical protein DM860_011955 [Cuscuta australis]|uniref:RING-type domain-containing protein n=1 Tax=Cuscuta australis TaxID=267555 RepID=A0A328D8G7_9ASTE|nr:hypothetical protein DM860_011955 [Cuscuta australis]